MKKMIQTSALSLMVGAFLAPNPVEAFELSGVFTVAKEVAKRGKVVAEETIKTAPRVLDFTMQLGKTTHQVGKHIKEDAPAIGKTFKKGAEMGKAIGQGVGRLIDPESKGADPYGADSKDKDSKDKDSKTEEPTKD